MKISMMALGFHITIPKPFHILIPILISSLCLPMLRWWGKINHFAKFVYNQGVTEAPFSTYKSCIHHAIAYATLMKHVVTLWVAVQASRQFLHVKHISLLQKRLITMYVVVLVEENENREFTRVRDHAHCVTKITHSWNAVHSFMFFSMIIEIEHSLSWKAILLSSVIVAKERVQDPLIRREAGIPR